MGRRLVLVLAVDLVRDLVSDLTSNPPAGETLFWAPDSLPPPLDVVSETAMRQLNGVRVRDEREGAEGHAGVVNLVACTRKQQHFLREQLASRISRYMVVRSAADEGSITDLDA